MSTLNALAMPTTSALSTTLCAQEEELGQAIDSSLDVLRGAIETHEGKARKPYAKAIKKLRRGVVPDTSALDSVAEASLQIARETQARVDATRNELGACFALEMQSVQEHLETIAHDPQFREAVAWQNLKGLRTGVDKIASAGVKYQRLIANYLQRYCAKNDTIGFFGPVGWAELDADSETSFSAGDQLLSKRTVYFEHWAVDALCEIFSERRALWPYIVPRQVPTTYVEGDTLNHSLDRTDPIPRDVAEAIRMCDGERTAHDVAVQLQAQGLVEELDEAYELLESLAEKDLLFWRFETPTSGFFPEKHLRSLLEAAPSDIAEQPLAELARLVEARDAVQASAGNVEELCTSLDSLNATFQELTGKQSTRAGGEVYAGRTLVFEDCQRDTQLTLGRGFVDKLAEPLTLILQSSTWYTWEIAQRYKRALQSRFLECAGDRREMPYLAFQASFRDLFPGPGSSKGIVHDVRELLQARWHSIIGAGTTAVELGASAIAEQVHEAFAAPAPGWPSARHHSPDVMLAAKGTEAFRRGDYSIVLGELHVGLATPAIPLFSKEHPTPESFAHLREFDLPEPGIAPTWNRALRANLYSTSAHDFDLESGSGLSRRERKNVMSAAECVVELIDGELVVRSRKTGRSFHLLAFIEQHLIAESYSEFKILGTSGSYAPRVTIDELVVRRAQWRVQRDSLAMIDSKLDRASMFHAVRRWGKELSLPRHCFVVSPTETKPFFLDFESSLAIENFARYVRQAPFFTVSEMLPAPGESWLGDAQDRLYCAEVRLCATTPMAWSYA